MDITRLAIGVTLVALGTASVTYCVNTFRREGPFIESDASVCRVIAAAIAAVIFGVYGALAITNSMLGG